MLYTVELDLVDLDRAREWEDWYPTHLAKLLSMPGFVAAQRFKAIAPDPSPYLAIYSVASPAAFESAVYKGSAGPGNASRWASSVVNWYRNLFDGLGVAPEVPADGLLAVRDVDALPAGAASGTMVWLRSAGMDATTPMRGFAFAVGSEAEYWKRIGGVRLFRPVGGRMHADDIVGSQGARNAVG